MQPVWAQPWDNQLLKNDDLAFSLALGARFRKPRSVTRHLIDFDIEPITGFHIAPCRDLQRVRDEVHFEQIAFGAVDGEAYPVDAHRALARDVFPQLRRHAEGDDPAAEGEDDHQAVDQLQAGLVVVEAEGGRVALLVDELLGQQQVVVKNLEANYRKVTDVSGATIMGDGRVALILDTGSLVRRSRH